jgi:DNA repair exonuclease SbcCD ATPase subunit
MVEDEARSLVAEINEAMTNETKFDKLHQAVKTVDEITAKQKELKEWLQVETEAIDLQKEIIDFQTREIKSQRLAELIIQLQENQNQAAKVREMLRYNTNKLAALKKKLKICPVCLKPFGSKKHEHL